MMDKLKMMIRTAEAALTPRESQVSFEGRSIRLIRSISWYDADQNIFDGEILPYFEVLTPDFSPTVIVDAGAAVGQFTLAACLRFPRAKIVAFEPSHWQRLMLKRNLRKNNVSDRVAVENTGLWNERGVFQFRTHGALSSMKSVSNLPSTLAFSEHVHVVPLDEWFAKSGLDQVDLIKMDIEGAEIEALIGARETLENFRPQLLVQAYHIRNGVRTLETCAEFLSKLGYKCKEIGDKTGFLLAV